jgi:hypothetical protein
MKMNDKDKQEFEKWFKDYWEVDFNAGNPRFMGQSIAWKYACEFKQKEIDILKNHDIAGYKEGIDCLQEKSEILVEALEKLSLYVSHNGDTWVKERATEALKKYRGEA